ncbi:hypothetical protein [Streptomyces sp. NRRL S-87]|uniref:hypothetical protein n=1 Tax=Streptomyces sp. NRRL S-87 TaxID=1463920 RepID=UPI0005644CE8|nr:hypothetical protein [Streptomyces sp. NRRL S-87]
MPAPQREHEDDPHRRPPRPVTSAPSMRDLLASCAAATAVSTPPSDGPAVRPGPPDAPGHPARTARPAPPAAAA